MPVATGAAVIVGDRGHETEAEAVLPLQLRLGLVEGSGVREREGLGGPLHVLRGVKVQEGGCAGVGEKLREADLRAVAVDGVCEGAELVARKAPLRLRERPRARDSEAEAVRTWGPVRVAVVSAAAVVVPETEPRTGPEAEGLREMVCAGLPVRVPCGVAMGDGVAEAEGPRVAAAVGLGVRLSIGTGDGVGAGVGVPVTEAVPEAQTVPVREKGAVGGTVRAGEGVGVGVADCRGDSVWDCGREADWGAGGLGEAVGVGGGGRLSDAEAVAGALRERVAEGLYDGPRVSVGVGLGLALREGVGDGGDAEGEGGTEAEAVDGRLGDPLRPGAWDCEGEARGVALDGDAVRVGGGGRVGLREGLREGVLRAVAVRCAAVDGDAERL